MIHILPLFLIFFNQFEPTRLTHFIFFCVISFLINLLYLQATLLPTSTTSCPLETQLGLAVSGNDGDVNGYLKTAYCLDLPCPNIPPCAMPCDCLVRQNNNEHKEKILNASFESLDSKEGLIIIPMNPHRTDIEPFNIKVERGAHLMKADKLEPDPRSGSSIRSSSSYQVVSLIATSATTDNSKCHTLPAKKTSSS